LPANGAADDLHGLGGLAKASDRDAAHSRSPAREKRGMPSHQAVCIQVLAPRSRRVLHDIEKPIHAAIGPSPTLLFTEPQHHGAADGVEIELLPLDGGGGDRLLGPQLPFDAGTFHKAYGA